MFLLPALLSKTVGEFNAANSTDDDCDNLAFVNTYESDIYFGPNVGEVTMKQLTAQEYNTKCLSINSKTSDNTGFRVYLGSHVALRCLGHLNTIYHTRFSSNLLASVSIQNKPELSSGVRVLELGCGCGALSAIASHLNIVDLLLHLPPSPACRTSKLVVTDGNAEALEISRYNFRRYGNSSVDTAFETFLWRDTPAAVFGTSDNFDHLDRLLSLTSNTTVSNTVNTSLDSALNENGSVDSRAPYDLIIGIEIFYYKIDVVSLMTDVLILLGVLENINTSTGGTGAVNSVSGDSSGVDIESTINPHVTAIPASKFSPRNSGMFFHAHHFRGANNQEQQLIDFLAHFGWSTVEIPLATFLGEEIENRETMGACRCLVSASDAVVAEMLRCHPDWVMFTAYAAGEDPEGDQSDGEGDNDVLYR